MTDDPNKTPADKAATDKTTAPPSTPKVDRGDVGTGLPVDTPAESAKRHIDSALKEIKAGVRTSLHLNEDERAEAQKYLKGLAEAHHEDYEVVRRLLAGEEVAGERQGK